MRKLFGVILVLIGAFMLVGLFFSQVSGFWWSEHDNEREKTVSVSNIDNIMVDSSSAHIKIMPIDNRDELKVVTNEARSQQVELEKNGNELEINIENDWFGWFQFFSDDNELVKIYLPKKYNKDVSLDFHSGRIAMVGTSQENPIRLQKLTIDMNSGSVEMNHVKVDQLVQDASSGSIEVNDVTAKMTMVDISSGQITMRDYTGGLKGELSSGHLDVKFDELTGNVDFQVSSGYVELDLPQSADFKLKTEVSSGDIDCDFPLKNMQSHDDGVKGVYGKGTYLIKLRASSGELHVY